MDNDYKTSKSCLKQIQTEY